MELFKVDLAKYYDAKAIKRILQIIKENNNVIPLVEAKLLEEGIFDSNQDNFFLRNKATYLREFGVYDTNITEVGQLYLNGEISEKELALLFLIKHCNEDNDELIRPFEILIKVTKLLKANGESTLISREEFCYILDTIKDNKNETIQSATSKIINNRKNNFQYEQLSSNSTRYYRQWQLVINESGLQVPTDLNNINIDVDKEIINYILFYYKNVAPSTEQYYDFNDPFVNFIQFPLKNNATQTEIIHNRRDYINFYPSIVYNYLFFGKSLRDIENEVFLLDKTQNGDLAKKILNGLNINSDTTNKGMYSPFEHYSGLIISKLKYSNDNIYAELAKMIDKYIKTDYRGEYSMDNVDILEKIKIKYFELEGNEDFQKELQNRKEVLEKFKSIFSIDHLKNMTLEDYDYPKYLDEEKYYKSLMYFVEKSKCGLPLGANKNKYFIYDKNLPDDADTKYSVIKWIKDLYPQLSVEDIFELYKEELVNFVTNFDKNTYSNDLKFLSSNETIKTQLIRFYYPGTLLYLVSNEIYNSIFNQLGIKLDKNLDSIQKNLLLLDTFKEKDDFFKSADIEILSSAIYKVWTEINAVKNEKQIDTSSVSTEAIMENIYQDNDLINDIIEVLYDKKNIILTGTPGVGKTFTTNDLIKLLEFKHKGKLDSDYESRIKFTQFHQSYGYEEFVEGMTLNNNKLEPKIGIFKYLVDSALKDEENNYYMIIDEINRGNISKIFGELLMCIEDDKRSSKYAVTLMYSDTEKEATFYVPKNVYIIGTMNTADRSLAQIDYALRRRFSFFNLKPAFDNNKFLNSLNNCEMKEQIVKTMKHINKILSDTFGNNNFDIGHSYFAKNSETIDSDKFRRILKYDIIPLIFEYMNDMDEKDIIRKFSTSDNDCKIFNDLLSEMDSSNED